MRRRLAICVRNEGYKVSLELRKIYEIVADASAERHKLVRVIDEWGEDYLYRAHFFVPVDLPKEVEKAPVLTT